LRPALLLTAGLLIVVAALVTGGFGVITEVSTGFPGYDSIIGPDNATIGRVLKENGFATSWFGKNHNTPDFQYSTAGPFDQWPSGMGFEYFYGFMGGETDQWTPYLFQNNKQIFPWIGKPGYNLTTDMADEAINYMQELNAAAPEKPFFVYYVPGGSHSPHQPKAEWVEKFKGKFDMGWNAMREQIFTNQKRLGVIPANAKLTDWPDSLPKWETLSADEKKLFARQAEVFAAYTAYTDHEIGRVIQQVQDMGKLDNTLIIYIVGDNGTSPEGTLVGTPNQYTAYNGILDFPVAEQLKFYDAWGSRRPTRTWRSRGRGRSTRRSSGPSRSRRISAARGRAWRSRGRPASRTPAACATSSTTSSTSCRRSSKPRVSRRRRWSTALSKSRSKA
jgi:arylsulfatase A-like enzyme